MATHRLRLCPSCGRTIAITSRDKVMVHNDENRKQCPGVGKTVDD